MLTLADILEALTGTRVEVSRTVITEAAIDSRQVIPGGLFVALPGERTDGHNFLGAAFRQGASLALVQQEVPAEFPVLDLRQGPVKVDATMPVALRTGQPLCLRVNDTLQALQQLAYFWRRKQSVRVIGITGSVGKSTTKELVAEVLSTRYRTLRNPGNLNNEIGLPLTLLRLGSGYQRAVLEMGFYVPGEIAQLCDLALPSVGVLTNIGTVHAERAGSIEAIARGKAELVQALPAEPNGTAILNYDDPYVRAMAGQTRARVFYYGLDPSAELWADEVVGLGLEGIRFRMHYHDEMLSVRVPLIGRHSVHTALRATAVGLTEGLSWGEIIEGLRTSQTQLRLVAVKAENGALLLDDSYNASPESTLAALNMLEEIQGRHIAVLGDMLELGQYEREGHLRVGGRAAEVADILVAVGELSQITAKAAQQAGMKTSQVTWVADVDAAIEFLKPMLREGDVVLVKGSHGLRMDRIVSQLEVAE